MKKTVIAPNSLGHDKEMDREEYVRRAVMDPRCMAFDDDTRETAERLLMQQRDFAHICFDALYARQNA